MKVEPITLNGRFVTLEPMSNEHLVDLCDIAVDPSIWQWAPEPITSKESMASYIDIALAEQTKGLSLPFATRENASGKIVGSTRFGNIDVRNRHVEIGWTWLAPKWQRTCVNTEAKLLMLTHAFEVWNCIRVEFKTDSMNEQSRNAILRIGAKQEGIHRNHMITRSGRFRDSVYFSIIDKEWSDVKPRLVSMLSPARILSSSVDANSLELTRDP
jgi:RimJ/RimL family protein N-acetyltransferase